MIPHIIHYCWFGRNPLPESALKCIASWRKYFPGWEIKEWNEDNFDVKMIPYTAEAYAAKKYAFVSDYARFWVLYLYGGVYFDTDVEVIRPFEDILAHGAFMGAEIDGRDGICAPVVAPGLGIGAPAQLALYKSILDYYATIRFIRPDGSHNITDAVVNITTRELTKAGLKKTAVMQIVESITIYPADFFNPFDDATGKLRKTENTHSIHWFSKTWLKVNPWRQRLSRFAHRIFGVNFFLTLHNILRK